MVLLFRSFTISCFDLRFLNSSSRSPCDFFESFESVDEAYIGVWAAGVAGAGADGADGAGAGAGVLLATDA